MPSMSNIGVASAAGVYTKQYRAFRGVDFTGDMTQIDDSRSPFAPNLISDAGGFPEKRIGWSEISNLGARINGIYSFMREQCPVSCICVRVGAQCWFEVKSSDSPSGYADALSWQVGDVLGVSSCDGWDAPDGNEVTISAVASQQPQDAFRFMLRDITVRDGDSAVFFNRERNPARRRYVIHAGTGLYVWDSELAGAPSLYASALLRDTRSFGRYFKDMLLILDGSSAAVFDGERFYTAESAAIAPRVLIGCVSGDSPGGSAYQPVNIATRRRQVGFSSDFPQNVQKTLTLGGYIPADSEVIVRYASKPQSYIVKWEPGQSGGTRLRYGTNSSGAVITELMLVASLDRSAGRITLEAKNASLIAHTTGEDNIVIEYACVEKQPVRGTFCVDFQTGGVTSFKDIGINPGGKFRPGDKLMTYSSRNDWNPQLPLTVDEVFNGGLNFTVTEGAYPSGNTNNTFLEKLEPRQSKLDKCAFCETYQGRVFYSGNPDYPNTDWYCQVEEPLYITDLSYTEVGSSSSAILGYVRMNEALAILKQDGAQDASIFLRTWQWDENGEMIFPVKQGFSGAGTIGAHACGTFLDDPVFLSRYGLYGIGLANVAQERSLQMRSSRINPRLTQEALDGAALAEWEGKLIIALGDASGTCYVADASQKTYAKNSTGTFEYEWYHWNGIPARVMFARLDTLLFGTEDGRVCRFNNYGGFLENTEGLENKYTMSAYSDNALAQNVQDKIPIVAQWATKMDDDGDYMTFKSMVKKGSGIMLKSYAISSVTVAIRTDRDFGQDVKTQSAGIFNFANLDFGNFSFNTSPIIIVPISTKIKKYKTIQVICRNDARDSAFGICAIIRRFTKGCFVKR